jgi:hypothetical protein
MSQRLVDSGAYFGEIQGALDHLAENQFSALDGLSEEDAARVHLLGFGDRGDAAAQYLEDSLPARTEGLG